MKKRKIDLLLEEYGQSHQNETNKRIHWICVPLIFFSIVGLLFAAPFWGQKSLIVNWAAIALFFALMYYLRLSFTMFWGFLIYSGVCLSIHYAFYLHFESRSSMVAISSLIVFAFGWLGQFYGHKIEGTKPSFLKDLQFLLIGPAWLMHFILKKNRISY